MHRSHAPQDSSLILSALVLTSAAFLLEARLLLPIGREGAATSATYRVLTGINSSFACYAMGATVLTAAAATLAAAFGSALGAPWWKSIVLAGWTVAAVVISVVLVSEARPLGPTAMRQLGQFGGWTALPARKGDYLYHAVLLTWLGLTGLWLAAAQPPGLSERAEARRRRAPSADPEETSSDPRSASPTDPFALRWRRLVWPLLPGILVLVWAQAVNHPPWRFVMTAGGAFILVNGLKVAVRRHNPPGGVLGDVRSGKAPIRNPES